MLLEWNNFEDETDLRYIGNNVEIEPIDVPIHTTFVEFLKMIYDIIGVDKDYRLVLKCRHPTEMNKFQPLVVRNDRTIAHEEDDRDYAIDTDEIHLPNDDENCCQTENIDLVMVQQVVECESTRFVNLEVGDRSNNPEVEFEVENTSLVASPHGTQFNISNDNLQETFVPISYHMPPTPQFLNMDATINCVAHQEFTVYRSNASVLVLQCKKAPECQWRLRAMTMKDTGMFRSQSTKVLIHVRCYEQFGYQISYQKAMKAKGKQ
ncbi:hypothetical protein AAG906_010179 [Vitis piasezkii]